MTTETLPKACVILGAGASHDVWDRGAIVIREEFKPPLARELFNISAHPAYQEILAEYPGAHFLAQQLASRLSEGVLGLEEALRGYSKHADPRIREHFKHVPAYLRDLIYRTSNQFVDIPSCYVQLVHSLLADYEHQVLFISLNYDDLLEKALFRFDSTLMFSDVVDYTAGNRWAIVMKLHGSINWFKPLVGSGSAWEGAVKRTNIIQRPADNEIIVLNDVESTKGSESGGNAIYPLITAPLAGKNLGEAVCPNEHLYHARQFLKDCQKFLIIGTSGLDDDLMEFLDSAVDPDLNPKIHMMVVGSGQSTGRT